MYNVAVPAGELPLPPTLWERIVAIQQSTSTDANFLRSNIERQNWSQICAGWKSLVKIVQNRYDWTDLQCLQSCSAASPTLLYCSGWIEKIWAGVKINSDVWRIVFCGWLNRPVWGGPLWGAASVVWARWAGAEESCWWFWSKSARSWAACSHRRG